MNWAADSNPLTYSFRCAGSVFMDVYTYEYRIKDFTDSAEKMAENGHLGTCDRLMVFFIAPHEGMQAYDPTKK